MNPIVQSIEPLNNYKLKISFDNGEQRLFDASPFLEKGVFRELKDETYFKSARVVFGSVEWPNEQDFSYDTLYILGTPL